MQRLGLAVLAATTLACGRATDEDATDAPSAAQMPPAGASLQGDVYLVMQNGDVKRGAGNTVYLLQASAALTDSIGNVCRRADARMSQLTREQATADREVDRLAGDTRASEASIRAANRRLGGIRAQQATVGTATDDVLQSMLADYVVTQTGTGVNGHYRFTGVEPGSYWLYARTDIGNYRYTWWAPASVARGDTVVADLDNSTVHLTLGHRSGLCLASKRHPGPAPSETPPTPAQGA